VEKQGGAGTRGRRHHDPHRGNWPAGSVLGSIPAATRQRMLELGTLRHYEPGKVLLREGEPSTHVILLVEGYVKVVATTIRGGVALLDIRVGGDLVGELAGLDGQPRSASVVTAGPSVVRLIKQPDFAAFLGGHPDAAAAVSRGIAAKLRWATRRRIDFGGAEVKVRVARVLVELAESYGELDRTGARIAVSLTQPELAGLVGAAEPTVHKALTTLRREQVIQTGYRRIAVLDERRLRAVAGLHEEVGSPA
jgi:CRP/FNR family transcriptional regulator, cyclic AMP receptor protein